MKWGKGKSHYVLVFVILRRGLRIHEPIRVRLSDWAKVFQIHGHRSVGVLGYASETLTVYISK